MVQFLLVGIALLSALALIGLGLLFEARSRHPNSPAPLLTGEPVAVGKLAHWGRRWRWAFRHHPTPLLGWFETAIWLLMVWSLFDHVVWRQGSFISFIIWLITFFPHEAGHVICAPFGVFLMFAGGSIWQVLIWALPGSYAYFLRRRLKLTMLFAVIAGHSFINMSVYIADARARQLTLTFGLVGKEGHDWWNILMRLGWLEYDQILAGLAIGLGLIIGLTAVGLGLLTTWFLPGELRFPDYPLPALAQAWDAAARGG